MNYELITAEDYNALPDEPELAFAQLEEIARHRLSEIIDFSESVALDEELRRQYMAIVSSAAEALGIPGLEMPATLQKEQDTYVTYSIAVASKVNKIRIKRRGSSRSSSVLLARGTIARINMQVDKLRESVNTSDMDNKTKEKLAGRLDEFTSILTEPRFRFSKALVILTAIAASTSAIADAPNALHSILRLVGADIQSEQEACARLSAPPPALTDQSATSAPDDLI